jgi:hypothetical protein
MGLIRKKARIHVGECTSVWAIWNYQNDVVFNTLANLNFLQVIHREVSTINMWSYLLHVDQRILMDIGYNRLMAVVQAIFT